jgi:hypothetical protein
METATFHSKRRWWAMALVVSWDTITILVLITGARSFILANAVAGVHGMESSCAPFFIFTAGAGKDLKVKIMTIINMTAGRQEKRSKRAKAAELADAQIVQIIEEYDLMLEEIENLLHEELIAIHLMRKYDRQNPALVFETAVRFLERKTNRSIQQDAVLAYARKKLKEESQKVQNAKCRL